MGNVGLLIGLKKAVLSFDKDSSVEFVKKNIVKQRKMTYSIRRSMNSLHSNNSYFTKNKKSATIVK